MYISCYTILAAVTSSSDQYGIENGVVSWEPAIVFSSIPIDCISGYQYTINETIIGNVSNSSFTLESSFTAIQSCTVNILTIRLIVMAGNSVLKDVVVTGHTCNKGKYIKIYFGSCSCIHIVDYSLKLLL